MCKTPFNINHFTAMVDWNLKLYRYHLLSAKLILSTTFLLWKLLVLLNYSQFLMAFSMSYFRFYFYWWWSPERNLIFDSCRNQKTFRPKKSAPTGSKVGNFASCASVTRSRLLYVFCGSYVIIWVMNVLFVLFVKCRVLNFKNTSMLHWVVGTWGKLWSCLLVKISMSGLL